MLQYGAPCWVEVVGWLAVVGPTQTLSVAPVWTGSSQRETHPPVWDVCTNKRPWREGDLRTDQIQDNQMKTERMRFIHNERSS